VADGPSKTGIVRRGGGTGSETVVDMLLVVVMFLWLFRQFRQSYFQFFWIIKNYTFRILSS
jgi:hypothetical protein